jgi:hypothetical protein
MYAMWVIPRMWVILRFSWYGWNFDVFLLVGGKTHCALIAARAINVSTWET